MIEIVVSQGVAIMTLSAFGGVIISALLTLPRVGILIRDRLPYLLLGGTKKQLDFYRQQMLHTHQMLKSNDSRLEGISLSDMRAFYNSFILAFPVERNQHSIIMQMFTTEEEVYAGDVLRQGFRNRMLEVFHKILVVNEMEAAHYKLPLRERRANRARVQLTNRNLFLDLEYMEMQNSCSYDMKYEPDYDNLQSHNQLYASYHEQRLYNRARNRYLWEKGYIEREEYRQIARKLRRRK